MGINPKYKLEKNNFSQEGGYRIISFTMLNPRVIIRNSNYYIKIIISLTKKYKVLFYLFKSNKIIYFLKARTKMRSINNENLFLINNYFIDCNRIRQKNILNNVPEEIKGCKLDVILYYSHLASFSKIKNITKVFNKINRKSRKKDL